MLRPGEGNALLITCGRQTLLPGEALCSLVPCENGGLSIRVTHGENGLRIKAAPEQPVEICVKEEDSVPLPGRRHSTRVFSDGKTVSRHPDFIAWDNGYRKHKRAVLHVALRTEPPFFDFSDQTAASEAFCFAPIFCHRGKVRGHTPPAKATMQK